jgi:hypothetical protein
VIAHTEAGDNAFAQVGGHGSELAAQAASFSGEGIQAKNDATRLRE